MLMDQQLRSASHCSKQYIVRLSNRSFISRWASLTEARNINLQVCLDVGLHC